MVLNAKSGFMAKNLEVGTKAAYIKIANQVRN